MRIRLFFLVSFCLCLLPHLGSTAQESADDKTKALELPTFSVLQKTESFELKTGEQEFTVKYPPILPNSEQLIAANGKLLVRNVDYQIDFYPGKITILTPDAAADPYRLKITYRTLPFAIKEVYKRDLYGEQNPDSGQQSVVSSQQKDSGLSENLFADGSQQPIDDSQTSQLEVSGSQTFGISVGSGRDVTPNQELRVNVEGNVSENISILALLSDQDLPIQPEGTTENIQDIDQKLVRITHPNMRGTLGDFEGSLGASEFIFFPRALEGVQVEGDFKWGKFHLIPSAIPKGQSTSLVLRGEEGRSEYRLTVDGQYVIVKAGSEIVWLNGERMRRGENNDYVIREYGDPIVEFNSKHLITSNDTIRIDFEYIPEERAYQQNLYGLSSVFTLPGERITLGASYAVEADLNQPEQALIQLGDTELETLRQNILDPAEDGSLLTAPQKHTVWGVESRVNITEKAWVEGELAYSNLDKNTYSTVDRKEVSQAWKLIGYADWDFATWTDQRDRGYKPLLHTNLDIRAMDADFVPVGASSSNRSRSRYETQYAKEGFDDAFLFDGAGRSQISRDERAANFDIRLIPTDWLGVTAGVGRSEEREPQRTGTLRAATDAIGETEVLSTTNATIRDNFNWGVNFNQRSGSGGVIPTRTRESTLTGGQAREAEASDKTPSKGAQLLRKLPNFRWDDYRSSSRVESEDSTRTQSQRKLRQEGNLSYPLGPFRLIGTLGRLESNEARNATLNRKRNHAIGRINLVDFSWVSVNTSYELEEAYAKEPLLTVDDAPIGLSDWQRSTTARTWKVGLFSQQKSFLSGGVNLTANLARRMLKAHTDLGADTTTQLADINLQLTPLSRAIDIELTYELDKKLTSQRHEIYTNIHPHTGVLLQPGEGYYVKLDDLHYVEDPEEGTYIKIYQNVGDKPTTAVDAEFRIRFQPRQYFARRARARQQQQRESTLKRDSLRPTLPTSGQSDTSQRRPLSGTSVSVQSVRPSRSEWFLSALRGQIRFWLTEEQEVEDAVSLYLLQNLQGSDTLFGRLNQHHRLEFSPSPAFSLEFNLRTGETLNKRINNQERHRLHNTWDVGFSVNPTKRLSVGANWEQRRENEKYSQFDFEDLAQETDAAAEKELSPTPISDLRQLEQTTELRLRYELSDAVRWSGIGGYKRTTDEEQLDEEPEAKTRTFSYENRITYRLIGKGRIDVNYKLGYGKSSGSIPFAQYTFYEGISHEVRTTADYRLRKFTDLLFRLNYRLLSTKHRKPEHRLEMTVSAEL